MTNSGGILATWLLGTLSPAPRYTKAGTTFLVFQVGILVCAQLNLAWLLWRNRWKAEVRAAAAGERGVEDVNAGVDAPCGEEVSPKGDASAWFKYTL